LTVSAHWRRVDIHSEKFAIWAREGLITRLRDGPRKSRPYGSLFGGVLAQHIASVDPYINGLLTPTSTVCWLLRQLAARYQAGKGKLRFLCPACLTFSSPCRLPSVVSLLDLSRLLGEWGGERCGRGLCTRASGTLQQSHLHQPPPRPPMCRVPSAVWFPAGRSAPAGVAEGIPGPDGRGKEGAVT
jgi:hypothetical protein